jgi:hypothetical protein
MGVMTPFSVHIMIVQDENVTVAATSYPDYEAAGSAKRHPADRHDPAVGIQLALSRLFQKMAEDYADSVKTLMAGARKEVTEAPSGDTLMREWLEAYDIPSQEM